MKLNPEQRAAVEHGAGPLLIVAGVGTGKTTVIVERALHLLDREDGNILALTFARKAAEEMQRRAREEMLRRGFRDTEARARRCQFSTFHAFCYGLLRAELPLRALDTIDQWIFFRRHLEELELELYLKVSEPGGFLHDLVDFCARCHDNLVRPEEYRAYVEQAAADSEQRRREGTPVPEEGEPEIARLRELARLYERSEELQEQENLLSFGAMISKTVSRLKASPPALHRLRRRYRYILVDEFQDTNAAQLELVSLLAGERANVTVVGDEYQAIYRFRGASYGSFELFKKQFPKHRAIVLQENHRSTRRILEVAEALAQKMDRYDPQKKLTPTQARGCEVEVREFAGENQQADWVAGEIARRVETGEAKKFSDVAVLYRKHILRDALVAALGRRGIPMTIRGLAVNDFAPVRDLLAYLRAIGKPEDSISLARVLADPQWGLDCSQLLPCCREAGHRKVSLRAVLEEDAAGGWPGRSRVLPLLDRYRRIAEQDRLATWLEALRREAGLGGELVSDSALRAFLDFVAQWDSEKSSTGLLEEFLEYFAYFEEAGGVVALPEESAKNGESDPGLLSVPESVAAEQLPLLEEAAKEPARGRVQLLTVHAAKGLEFEQVFLFHLVQRAFPVPNREPLISLPAPLWKGPLLEGDFHLEEERRLFYVGLTRAKRRLTFCTLQNERQKPSLFLRELKEANCPQLVWRQPQPVPTPERRSGRPEEFPPARTGSRIAAWAREIRASDSPDGFSLSASGLETYLQCPLQYQFRYGWRIPLPPAPPRVFGTAMHSAVKEVVGALAQGPRSLAPDALEAILNRHWPAAGFSDSVQERKYRREGLRQLEGIRKTWSQEPFELLCQEKRFQFEWAGTTLAGRFDQINRCSPTEAELIEYKTGRPQTQKEADSSAQLTLYAAACRRVWNLEPRRLVLFNLTTGERVQTTRTSEQFRVFELTIRQTAAAIRAGEFPPRPGFLCRYCHFRPLCPAHEKTG